MLHARRCEASERHLYVIKPVVKRGELEGTIDVRDRREFALRCLVSHFDGDSWEWSARLINHSCEHRRLRSRDPFDFEFDFGSMSLELRLLTGPGTECKCRESAHCCDQSRGHARCPLSH